MSDNSTRANVPTFAVVGRVNKGKSSVVASLIENDSVRISPRPGTTTECVRYDVSLDRLLFSVIDTPGFEDAPRALHWMKQREKSAANRPHVVREFVETFASSDEFVEECRLLRPVLDGACVLYVVGADEPYRANHEAEMEILRWTGQPAMALINRTSSTRYLDDWKRALDQFFQLVREFDAHAVTYDDRIKLLEAWKVLMPAWEAPLSQALDALEQERLRRRYEVAGIATDLICQSLSYHLNITLRRNEQLSGARTRLEQQFHDKLRGFEADAHRRMARVYLHRLDGWTPDTPAEIASGDDLFAEETWKVMGLSPMELVTVSTLAGATAGGTIDAITGGASFLAGTVLGAMVGAGVGVNELRRRFASAFDPGEAMKSMFRGSDRGPTVRVGPHPSLNFPFVLLGRALHHFDRVRAWAHAVPELPKASGDAPVLEAALDRKTRQALADVFKSIRKQHLSVPPEARSKLHRQLCSVFDAHVASRDSATTPR